LKAALGGLDDADCRGGVGSNWVGFGYPARAVGKGKKQRKPLRQVAHLERYGRPFE
jgi:hypothetical protein